MHRVPFTKLLPNIITLFSLIIGVSSIRFALDAKWEFAVYCIIFASLADAIDGRVARSLNATSVFGAELDSLCDFVNFGLCPAMLLYLWSFQHYEFKMFSWCSIMLFIVCMAIRLARFNSINIANGNGETNKDTINDANKSLNSNDDRFFLGVPAPSGALLVLIPIILDFEISSMMNLNIRSHTLLINSYVIFVALLLPSRFATISTKKLFIRTDHVALSMIILSCVIIGFFMYTWYILPVLALLYICSILPLTYYKLRSQKERNNT